MGNEGNDRLADRASIFTSGVWYATRTTHMTSIFGAIWTFLGTNLAVESEQKLRFPVSTVRLETAQTRVFRVLVGIEDNDRLADRASIFTSEVWYATQALTWLKYFGRQGIETEMRVQCVHNAHASLFLHHANASRFLSLIYRNVRAVLRLAELMIRMRR